MTLRWWLSALAVHRHAARMLDQIDALASQEGWSLAPVVLVRQGRVAIGDEVGELLDARTVIVLIGERPGLSSPDSLGLYLTYTPRVGLTDAARNCISNIRAEGLSYAEATHKLGYLLREAFRRKLSGVQLKDEAEQPALLSGPADVAPRTFLLPD